MTTKAQKAKQVPRKKAQHGAAAAASSRDYTLASITTGSAYNQMQVKLFHGSGWPGDYTAFAAVEPHLAAYASGDGRIDFYTTPPAGSGFGKPAGTAGAAAGFDLVVPVTIGKAALLAGYTAASGAMTFYALSGTSIAALTQSGPAFPKDLTTIVPFRSWGGSPFTADGASYLLCYTRVSGTVGIYALTVSGKKVGVTLVWSPSKPWATGWTRFGLFQFGTENFFIKTNEVHKTVFIDHIMDVADKTQGTHPAAEHLPLPLNLTAIATFTLAGDPCFATYLASSGAVTFNRFLGDLSGWTPGAKATAVTGGTTAAALPGSIATVLFY